MSWPDRVVLSALARLAPDYDANRVPRNVDAFMTHGIVLEEVQRRG